MILGFFFGLLKAIVEQPWLLIFILAAGLIYLWIRKEEKRTSPLRDNPRIKRDDPTAKK